MSISTIEEKGVFNSYKKIPCYIFVIEKKNAL